MLLLIERSTYFVQCLQAGLREDGFLKFYFCKQKTAYEI